LSRAGSVLWLFGGHESTTIGSASTGLRFGVNQRESLRHGEDCIPAPIAAAHMTALVYACPVMDLAGDCITVLAGTGRAGTGVDETADQFALPAGPSCYYSAR